MDYPTAYAFLLTQGSAQTIPETLLQRLSAGQAPIPGQLTALLLALKVVYKGLRGQPTIDRPLAAALHYLAQETRLRYDAGLTRGVDWPPLLREDLQRVNQAVWEILSDPAALDDANRPESNRPESNRPEAG